MRALASGQDSASALPFLPPLDWAPSRSDDSLTAPNHAMRPGGAGGPLPSSASLHSPCTSSFLLGTSHGPCKLSWCFHLCNPLYYALTLALDYMEMSFSTDHKFLVWNVYDFLIWYHSHSIYLNEKCTLFVEFKQKLSSIKEEKRNHAKSHHS